MTTYKQTALMLGELARSFGLVGKASKEKGYRLPAGRFLNQRQKRKRARQHA